MPDISYAGAYYVKSLPRQQLYSMPFQVDKSSFLTLWWEEMVRSEMLVMMAPTGFGKSSLMYLVKSFFSLEHQTVDFKGQEISRNLSFVNSFKGRYGVVLLEFEKLIGTCWESSKEAFGLRSKSGAEYLGTIISSHPSGGILLIDDFDIPLLSGFLYDYYEEVLEFYGSLFLAVEGMKDWKICLTSTSNLFFQELYEFFPVNTVYHNIYSDKFGIFFGFKVGAIQTMMDQLPDEWRDRCIGMNQILRKFGGYRTDLDIQQTLHPSGILQICESDTLVGVCRVNSFSSILPLLIQIFGKMNLCYWSLLSIIHNNVDLDVKRSEEASSSETEHYSFFDFVSLLHDYGLMAKWLPKGDMYIANVDARLAIMGICDYFMRRMIK